ncbi:hypothetical protein C8R46DRAFT_1352593 [Mycena filopes]|nr:hypothetical protein C8R46DRAFT_1352593 [Mycena filopes]
MASLEDSLLLLDKLEDILENWPSDSPTSYDAKRRVRDRLDRVRTTLPSTPPARRPRAPSEPPAPAQPPAPAPPEPSTKELKTIRCKKRAQSTWDAGLISDLLDEGDFYHRLFHPVRGPRQVNEEDDALLHLIRPYIEGTEESWRQARGAVKLGSFSLSAQLREESAYLTEPNLAARLVLRNQNLTDQEGTSDISTFLRNLIHGVNAIQFSLEVAELGRGPGGVTRKTELYTAIWVSEGSPGTYKTWKTKLEQKIGGRNRLADVYKAFGPIIFFDTFWNPRNLEPNRRHNDFGETLKELIALVPKQDNPLAEYLPSTKAALSHLLNSLYSKLEPHIMDFVTDFEL